MNALRRKVLWGATLASLAIAAAAPASAVAAHRPVIKRFSLSGAKLSEEAGIAALKIQVRGATSCTLDGPAAVVGVEWTGRCTPRTRTYRVWLPANRSATPQHYRLVLIARGRGGVSRRYLLVVVPGEPKLSTGVWIMTFTNLTAKTAPEEFPIEFLPGGTVFLAVGKTSVSGGWTYKHGQLNFYLSTPEGREEFSVSGPPGGPLNNPADTVTVGGTPVVLASISLRHA